MSEQISNIGPGTGLSRTTATASAANAGSTRPSESLRVGDKVEVQFGRSASANETTIQVRSADGRSAWSAPERVRVDSNLPSSLAQRLMGSAIARTQATALQIHAEVVATTPALVLKLMQPGQASNTGAAPGTQAWLDQQLRLAMPHSRPLGGGLALLGNHALGQAANRPVAADPLGNSIQHGIATLLDTLPSAQDLTNPSGVARAVRDSGLWMEALLAGSLRQPGRPLDLSRDLKATLLQLAQSIRTAQSQGPTDPAGTSSPTTGTQRSNGTSRQFSGATGLPDAMPAPERFLESAASPAPRLAPSASQDQANVAGALTDEDHDATASTAKQDIATASLGRHVEGMLKHLVSQQLQALEAGPDTPRWPMELPFRTPEGVLALDADLKREKRADADAEDAWNLRIRLDLPRLGPLSIDLNLRGGRLNAGLRCGTESGAATLRARIDELQTRLEARSLEVASLHVGYQADPIGQRQVRSLHISERA